MVNQLQSHDVLLCFPSHVSDVKGEAVSEFSKDPADNSTNYCSLQNLMDGNISSDFVVSSYIFINLQSVFYKKL